MPPILVHFNMAGWLSLGGLYLGLTAVLLLGLKAAGVSPRDLDRELLPLLASGVFITGMLIWTVAVILHCDLIYPETCQPLAYLFHLSAR